MEWPSDAEARWELHTHSGSVYRICRTPEGWLMSADNVPTPTSVRLAPGRWWPIQRPEPWPLELGARITLMAPVDLERDDPRRCPGGGKITSPLRAIREVG